VLAPKVVAKQAGLPRRSGLIRGDGVREPVAGGLILAAPKKPDGAGDDRRLRDRRSPINAQDRPSQT